MFRKLILLFTLLSGIFMTSCKESEVTPASQTIAGKAILTQQSFTPIAFENGKPTKAKIVQTFEVTDNKIGKLTATLNVDYDLIQNKSGEVLAFYADKDGDRIYTTSSSVANATGLNITEKIIGGSGKFAKISGGGTYFMSLNFVSGNGSGDFSWTVTY